VLPGLPGRLQPVWGALQHRIHRARRRPLAPAPIATPA
jgi:hypothetical protein